MNNKQDIKPNTPEEIIKLMESVGTGALYSYRSFGGELCVVTDTPYWNFSSFRYEIVEPELTKPSVDWSQVNPQFNWLATDAYGSYFYSHKPTFDGVAWFIEAGNLGDDFKVCGTTALASFVPGTCAAEDSLVQRPESCTTTNSFNQELEMIILTNLINKNF